MLSYIQAKLPDKNYDVAGIMAELVNYNRSPDYVSEGFSTTVIETLEIIGKSIQTLFNGLSLLKFFDEIQTAIRQALLLSFCHYRAALPLMSLSEFIVPSHQWQENDKDFDPMVKFLGLKIVDT